MLPALSRMLLTTDTVGGVWRYTTGLAHGLRARGVTPIVATLGPPPNDAQRLELAGIELVVTDLPLDWRATDAADLIRTAAAIAALAAAHGVDTLHLHAPALLGEARPPCRVVAVLHSCLASWWDAMGEGALPPAFAWRSAFTAAGLAGADRVIVPSRALAETVARLYSARRLDVVHNGGVPPPMTIGDRDRVVLTSGRLWDRAKNAAALDRAAALIEAPVRAAGADVAPDGGTIALPSLHLLGQLAPDRLAVELAGAAVFCSLARYEPFGLGVLEAAQSGCALVLSDIPTFRELWDGAAIFADPGDPVAVADALRAALDRPGPLAAAARARASRYTIAAMTDATLAVHSSALLQAA